MKMLLNMHGYDIIYYWPFADISNFQAALKVQLSCSKKLSLNDAL